MNFVNASTMGQLEMARTNTSHITSQVSSKRSSMVSNTDLIDNAVRPETMSFEQTLLKAFDSVRSEEHTSELQ